MAFPVDQKYVERAERELGFLLPRRYVSRLRRENGGEMEVAGDISEIMERSEVKRSAASILLIFVTCLFG